MTALLVARPRRSHARVLRWVALCAAAEGIGMTAAATAAKTSLELFGEPAGSREVTVALTLVVAGGLVEGVALGGLQGLGLRRLVPRLRVGRFLAVTTAVAGVGWAAASAPAVLAGPGDDSAPPPVLLVLGGAAALGVAMGALLGAAQAAVLRPHVRHPWGWVTANALAWAPAMAVIFLGATAPGADWSFAGVLLAGVVTGVTAGAALGLVTGWFLPSLDGPPAYNRVVVGLLSSRAHRLADRSLVVLRLRGAVTGRTIELPVQYAADGPALVVVPGRPETKRWWRNLAAPAPVEVLDHGTWRPAEGRVLRAGDPGHDEAVAAYRSRWRHAAVPADAPVVRIRRKSVAGAR